MKQSEANKLRDWLSKASMYSNTTGLQFLAKKTLAGLADGLHNTSYNSDNFEFSQFRNYNAGDDVRLIDWKTFGKTDKYYIKQSQAEQQLNFRLIPDLSASMAYAENGISKLDCLKYLMLTFGNIANTQNDNLHYFDESKSISVKYLQHKILALDTKGKWNDWQVNYKAIQSKKGKSLLIYISDLYDYNNEMLNWLKQLNAAKNELVVFQIMGRNEAQLSFKNKSTLKDLETGNTLTLTASNKKQILNSFENAQKNIKENLQKNNIEHRLIYLAENPMRQINQFLKQRRK